MPTITTVDATWDTGVSMDAAELRRADTAMFLGDGTASGVRGGIVRHGDTSLAVTVNGSDQVTVQPGAFVIPAATGLGAYRGSLAAATAATAITARNATNPRIDLVVIQATGTNATVKTIDGTPAASPTAPALPAQHIELARITVPAVGGGAVTVANTFRAYAAGLGGTLYVEAAAQLPTSGNQKGQRAVALDTGYGHTFSGGAWMQSREPAGILGYAQVTAAQGPITASADLTGLSAAVTVGTSRRIRVTGSILLQGSVLEDSALLAINEGATQLQRAEATIRGTLVSLERSIVLSPAAGAHTYKLTLGRNAGSGNVTMQASATFPAFILVEDIGAA